MTCEYCRREHAKAECPGCGAPPPARSEMEIAYTATGVMLMNGIISVNEARELQNQLPIRFNDDIP